MNEEQTKRGGLFAGIILIAFGCMFLLDRFLVVDFGDLIGSYWPMIVVLVGVFQLFDGAKVWNGLWLIAVGAWLQVANLGLWGVDYGNSWPLLLIALGAGLVIRAVVESAGRKERTDER